MNFLVFPAPCRRVLLGLCLPLWGFLPATAHAQLEPPATGGAVAVAHALRMLGHQKRVLMIGAHPDDEDTELLTLLVRHVGAEAAYLSLNRGEGGQNLIGPELGEALGLIRTGELLAARELDGARQYFTRAYDFGYSKDLDDVWSHWPRDSILKDVVRIIRRFRPQVVVSVWSGTPRDGHGQHEASGVLAREAFGLAGSASAFPSLAQEEGLAPWTPAKLYRSTRFDRNATTLVLEAGILDPALGRSIHQVAMQGRSLHRSQDMGVLQRIGPATVNLALVEDRTGSGAGDFFSGIDTTLVSILGRGEAERLSAALERLTRALPADTASALRSVVHAMATLSAASAMNRGDSSSSARLVVDDQLRHLRLVRRILEGRMMDAVIDDARIVPGQEITIRVTTVGGRGTSGPIPPLRLPMGWQVLWDSTDACAGFAALESCTRRSRLRVGPETPPTTPYFLARPRQGSVYDWSEVPASLRGEPFDSPAVVVHREIPPAIATENAGSVQEVTFRFQDQATGERRLPLVVVPRVGIRLEPTSVVWSLEGDGIRRVRVTLSHNAQSPTRGEVGLELPSGWPRVPPVEFALTEEDERRVFTFDVARPANLEPGTYDLRAVAVDEQGNRYTAQVVTLSYPHIRPRSYLAPASATIVATPLVLPRLNRVGYVRGASDRVPEALRDIGLKLEILDDAMLTEGDLAGFGAIVIGSRAYETDPMLGRANDRLLDYVRAGGLLIVQYQQYQYFANSYAPYPLTVGGRPLDLTPDAAARQTAGQADSSAVGRINRHDRVTDERAPVRLLDAGDPVLTMPNTISSEDFEGWIQERGLYFARTWDRAYRSVLETHDRGEPPLEGGLLIATVGRGHYVYTGLSFFRQLPAGVPGAFRLFANLLALGTSQEAR